MMVIRPVEKGDLPGLMTLAGETGGGLTSLPADEATLAARIERSQMTWRGELPKSEQGYVFVLEDCTSGAVAGICAIEVPDRETGGTCAKCQKLMAGRTVDQTDQYGKNIEANQVVAYLA